MSADLSPAAQSPRAYPKLGVDVRDKWGAETTRTSSRRIVRMRVRNGAWKAFGLR